VAGTTPALPDADAPQRRAADPGASVWVAASAGTGKTKVLTDRVLSLLVGGTEPHKILCLTFTKAAAAEMETRIAEQLGQWAVMADGELAASLTDLLGRKPPDAALPRARRLFADVLDTPGGMNIQTIHAFCQSLLGRFPLEAGIAPHFSVMDERDAKEMLESAKEEVLSMAREGARPVLGEALAAVTDQIHETQFSDLMVHLANARGRLHRLIDEFGSVEGTLAATRDLLGLAHGGGVEAIIEDACRNEAFDAIGLKTAIAALGHGSEADAGRGGAIAAWMDVKPEDRAAAFGAYADIFLANQRTTLRKTLITKAAAGKAPAAAEILRVEAERVLAAVQRRRAAVTLAATAGLLRLGAALLDAYKNHKERQALLDYDDLILAARDLLGRAGIAPWVLYKLDGGIDHILIDEAQDTNPEQWRVVAGLANEFFEGISAREETRTLFAVGDVKQSIYSFQRADPREFLHMRDHFADKVQAAEGQWRQVELNISFRSTRAVLDAVDAVFGQAQAADGVSLDGAAITHTPFRQGEGGLVEVWPPVDPLESDQPAPWKPPVERYPGDQPSTRLARLIARRIHAMVTTGEILESRGGPITPGDVMVLVRRRTGFVEDLVRELKRLHVGVAGVDRMVLTEQLAVMDLVALGHALLLPGDDLTLATVLKGPLIGLDEDQLFNLAWGREGSLWRELGRRAPDEPAFQAAHEELLELLSLTDCLAPFELFSHVLGPRRGREKLLRRLGPDADDPIAEFLNAALAFGRGHAPSLQGFLHWLETGAEVIKRDLEQARPDAVRVMTVHGAKGLQAPIVFLPDTLQVPRRSDPLLWPRSGGGAELMVWPPARAWSESVADAEREHMQALRDQEYRRLLYVAMTRAEDRLYVCGWNTRQKAPEGCWYNLVTAGLDGLAREAEDPFLAQSGEIKGGAVLRVTSAQEHPPTAAADSSAGEPVLNGLPPWATQPAPEETGPPSPLAPSRPVDDEPPVRTPFGEDDGNRFKRGRVIHRLLQSLPGLPPGAREPAARAYLAQPALDLDGAAQGEIVRETLKVLDAPEFAHLFGPDSMAEVPLTGRVRDHVISAQVDRLVVAKDTVFVVDYKTNRPPPENPEDVPAVYLRQMAAYGAALEAVYPERAVACLLLWTDGPRLMALPDEILKPHAP